MANVGAVCASFKKELMLGGHAFHATGVPTRTAGVGDAFKVALITPAGNAGVGTANYSELTATEVPAGGGYSTGGLVVTWFAPQTANGKAYTTPNSPAPLVWTGVSFTTDCAFFYNTSQGNKAVAVYTFLSQTVSGGGNFTLTLPSNSDTAGLLRIE